MWAHLWGETARQPQHLPWGLHRGPCTNGNRLFCWGRGWAVSQGAAQWPEDHTQGRLARRRRRGGSLWPWPSYSSQEKGPLWRWPHTVTPAAESAAGTQRSLGRRLRPTSKASSGHRTQSPSQQGQGAERTHCPRPQKAAWPQTCGPHSSG